MIPDFFLKDPRERHWSIMFWRTIDHYVRQTPADHVTAMIVDITHGAYHRARFPERLMIAVREPDYLFSVRI